MSVDSLLLFINESILAARMPVSLPPWLLVFSSRRNPRRGLTVTHPEVGGQRVESLFNKNVIKLGDNKEYIKKAVDTIAVLYTK